MTKEEIDYLIRVLRKGTIGSRARNECFRRHSKRVFVRYSSKGKSVYKLHWRCASCNNWYRDQKSLECDHIEEIGPFKGDWHDFITRMYFCGQKNLQLLCNVCHLSKTQDYANARLKFKRKNPKK